MSLLGPCWYATSDPTSFYRDSHRCLYETYREALHCNASVIEIYVGAIERMVTVNDDQIDVSETWRPKLVDVHAELERLEALERT